MNPKQAGWAAAGAPARPATTSPGMASVAPITRTMVLWCPDWPVGAAARAGGLDRDAPVALIDRGLVFACSAAARRDGVRRGLRHRVAQACCPGLVVLPYDPALDNRSFEPVIAAIEEVMPGVQLLRPGTCAIRSRGPGRYYGSEEEAALWLLDVLEAQGIADARVGIADGPFAAECAARGLGDAGPRGARIQIVPGGRAAEFLGPLPVGLLDSPGLVSGSAPADALGFVTLLGRLGVYTLADFAALPAGDVLDRFGAAVARLHAIAGGLDGRAVVPRDPPEEIDGAIEFEPSLDRIDQVTFGFRATAGVFVDKMTAAGLVCTAIRIEVTSERGEVSDRCWLHPRSFTATDVVDRVRWQLQGGSHPDGGLGSPIVRVRVVPESVDAIGNHEEGLWGTAPDERVHHGLSRVQSMLGHDSVLTAVVGGGRTLADRQNLVSWGDRAVPARSSQPPWPGRLPAPAPAVVFETPRPVQLLDSDGAAVQLDDRGMVSAAPEQFGESGTGRGLRRVRAWAGPWPVDERWWDAGQARRVSRFQLVDSDGSAWLLVLDGEHWWAEARYD